MGTIEMEDQFLKTIGRFSNLTEQCKQEFVGFGKIVEQPKHFQLVSEGEISDKLFFILQGSARHYYLRRDKDVTSRFVMENSFMCSAHSFYFSVPSPTNIELMEDSIYYEFRREDISYLEKTYHAIETLSRVYLAKLLTEVQNHYIGIQFNTALERYQTLLETTPDITQRASLGNIASYLGIAQETLSRIRSVRA